MQSEGVRLLELVTVGGEREKGQRRCECSVLGETGRVEKTISLLFFLLSLEGSVSL